MCTFRQNLCMFVDISASFRSCAAAYYPQTTHKRAVKSAKS